MPSNLTGCGLFCSNLTKQPRKRDGTSLIGKVKVKSAFEPSCPLRRVKCFVHEHKAVTPAKARTRSTRSGDQRANHLVTTATTDRIFGAKIGLSAISNLKKASNSVQTSSFSPTSEIYRRMRDSSSLLWAHNTFLLPGGAGSNILVCISDGKAL